VRSRPGLRTFALAPLLGAAVGLVMLLTSIGDSLEDQSLDLRARLTSDGAPSNIAVVAIDSKTFDPQYKYERWPFRRSRHAKVIDELRRAGVKTIVYDVEFAEPTKEKEDLALYDAISRKPGTVLAATEIEDGETDILGGPENTDAAGALIGAANLPTESESVIRKYLKQLDGLPSLASQAVKSATGRRPKGFDSHDEAWIDYRGRPGTFPTLSFVDVERGKFDPAAVRGKIVVVGATAPSLQDLHATPMSHQPMTGPELQANAIATALDNNPLGSAPTWIGILIVLFGSAAPAVLATRLRLVLTVGAALLLAAAYALAAYLAYNGDLILPVAPPLSALAVATITTIVASYTLANWERARVAQLNEVLEERVRERTAELRLTQLEVVHRLGQAAEARDGETGLHIQRIGHLSRALGLERGMSLAQAEILQQASAMHDVGKIGIPDRILLKPGRLEQSERELMQTHTTIGAGILSGSRSPLLQMAEEIALTHHERWDGSGYPNGLRGEEIPLPGRICAIVDVFDALMSARTYKEAWTLDAALEELRKGRGTHFDPELLDDFIELAPHVLRDLTARGLVAYAPRTDAEAAAGAREAARS
jgi:HD-GYP domain-containing protein (c-di-GMP phosphodiesterase class II)